MIVSWEMLVSQMEEINRRMEATCKLLEDDLQATVKILGVAKQREDTEDTSCGK